MSLLDDNTGEPDTTKYQTIEFKPVIRLEWYQLNFGVPEPSQPSKIITDPFIQQRVLDAVLKDRVTTFILGQ